MEVMFNSTNDATNDFVSVIVNVYIEETLEANTRA